MFPISIDFNKFEVIDLSHDLFHRMPGWPGHSEFTLQDLKILNIDGYSVKKLSINTHHGTHMDVEAHMVENGRTLENYSLDSFMGNAVVIDVSDTQASSPISLQSVKDHDKLIQSNSIVLLHTGHFLIGFDEPLQHCQLPSYGWELFLPNHQCLVHLCLPS